MAQIGKKEGRVPLNSGIVSKCICDVCSVQAKSSCAVPKIQNMKNVKSMSSKSRKESSMPSGLSMRLAEDPKDEMDFNSADIGGIYCASGVASCKDLDLQRACICPGCQVYKDYSLLNARPVEHFCFNDKAV